MLLIECNNIKKSFGERQIIEIEQLKLYSEDRIGVIGRNGAGKTTLLNILRKKLDPDEGWVRIYGKAKYISQLDPPVYNNICPELASEFNIRTTYDENFSGGEKTRFKLAGAFEYNSEIFFADEPTSNLDIDGIKLVEDKLSSYSGALVLVSHDRILLDRLCNKILEIEEGRIKIYKGNYSDYKEQKSKENMRIKSEYEDYTKERKRLEEVIKKTKQKVKGINKPPKRMGNSEARLHKMGGQKAKAGFERTIKNIEKRIEHLEIKESLKEQPEIRLNIMGSDKLYNKIIIKGNDINRTLGNKAIFKNADFKIPNGSKTALIGPNGCGKTTLIKMIIGKSEFISIAKDARIGYFSQDLSILKEHLTVIENVMENSIYNENYARLLLARLLIRGKNIYKKTSVLSSGEKVKVSFAKMLMEDINLLILDEPTNYMDINALEIFEETLSEYDGTLLFSSHDRKFIKAIADNILLIDDLKIVNFKGTYSEYLYSINKESDDLKSKQVLVLKNRLTEVVGRLSMPSKADDIVELDKEYHFIVNELRKLGQ
ncbi:MAG: ABC-F type ribosomal protection protein [Clostridiales bacterium]|nr:ABC-F type ribosomal protection protein [Clostridiales bacterium]